uniref:Uncharacterized protein n=1 Tax=Cucumis melo TaxID=3656 RepID=A0A9I9E749_CUCME
MRGWGSIVQYLDSVLKGITYLLTLKRVGVNSVFHPMFPTIHPILPLKWKAYWANANELRSPMFKGSAKFPSSLRQHGVDPAKKKGYTRAARERIKNLEGRRKVAFAILKCLNCPGEESHGAEDEGALRPFALVLCPEPQKGPLLPDTFPLLLSSVIDERSHSFVWLLVLIYSTRE